MAAETAAIGPEVVGRNGQRQIVTQLKALGQGGRGVFKRVAVDLVVLGQLAAAVVDRDFGIVEAAARLLELCLAQGVVVVVFLGAVFKDGIGRVAIAIFEQGIPFNPVGAHGAFATPFFAFGMGGRDKGFKTIQIAGVNPRK